MNQENFKKFSDLYRELLLAAITADPSSYYISGAQTVETKARMLGDLMLHSIETKGIDSVNISGTMKKVAKKLGIKGTYKAIKEFLEQE